MIRAIKQRIFSDPSANYGRLFLAAAYILIFAKMSGKISDASKRCHWISFSDPALIVSLAIVLLVNVIFLIVACNWSRIIRVPVSFLFLILPFAFYLALLVNALLFHWNDFFVLIGLLVFLISYALIAKKDPVKQDNAGLTAGWGNWVYLLIVVFIVHGVLLFLGQNFKVDRLPFADENSFWYVAARTISEKGFLVAHQSGYPGGGLHPLGVPFLSALPGILFHSTSPAIPFFMPVYVLIGITLVLLEFADQRLEWSIVFFLVAWFASFNNRSWSGSLFYSMVYGESVSMVLVLSLLNWFVGTGSDETCRSWWLSGFLMGLLLLTKFPLILLSAAFFAAFLTKNRANLKNFRKISLMIILFFVPFFILKIFQMKYGGSIAAVGNDANMDLQKLLSPNADLLRRVVSNIAIYADNLAYYFSVSVIFSVFCCKRWRYGWPVIIWVSFLFIHYAYLYSYGSTGLGDAASGLRYFLPACGGFFLIGSYGFAGLIDRIKRMGNIWVQPALYITCLAVIFYKFF